EAEAKKQAENEAQRSELRLVIGHLQEFADRIKSGLHDADWLTRREILRALVKRVEVDETQMRVIYRIDPLPFDHGPARGRLQDCWRRPRHLYRHLLRCDVSLGAAARTAYSRRGDWHRSNTRGMTAAYPNAWFHERLVSLTST